jgi:hypothetical protein
MLLNTTGANCRCGNCSITGYSSISGKSHEQFQTHRPPNDESRYPEGDVSTFIIALSLSLVRPIYPYKLTKIMSKSQTEECSG